MNIKEMIDTVHQDTEGSSFLSHRYEHPLYQKIIDLGKESIPYLLDEVKEDGGIFWHKALREITKENPVPKDVIKSSLKAEYWLKWGKENGFLGNNR